MYGTRKRRGYGRRPTYGARTARTTRGSVPVLRRRLAAAKSRARRRNVRIGGFLGLERKFLDCAWNGVALPASTDGSGGELAPSSGCTAAISVPAQGDGESNRDGRKYTIKSAYVSGVIGTSALSDQDDPVDIGGYYIAMVLDTQTNGAAAGPNSEDVYINPSTLAGGMLPQPLRNLQNSKRFKILDSTYIPPGGAYATTDGASTASISNQIRPSFTLSWRGSLDCDSVGTTAAAASASDNAIFLMGFANQTSLIPTVIAKSRVRFYG